MDCVVGVVEEVIFELIESATFWSEIVAGNANLWILEGSHGCRRHQWSEKTDASLRSCLQEGWVQQFRPCCGAQVKRVISLRGDTFASVTPKLTYFTDENHCRLAVRLPDGSNVYHRVVPEDVSVLQRLTVSGVDALRLANLYAKNSPRAATNRSRWEYLLASVSELILVFLDVSGIAALRLSSREGNACCERSSVTMSRIYRDMFRWMREPRGSNEMFSWFACHPFVHWSGFAALERARIAARILSAIDVSEPHASPVGTLLRSIHELLPFYRAHAESSRLLVRVSERGAELASLSCNVDCVSAVVDKLISYRCADAADSSLLVSLWYDPFVVRRDTAWSPLDGGLFFVRYRATSDFGRRWLAIREEVLALAAKPQLHTAM